jgi:adenylate cyclase
MAIALNQEPAVPASVQLDPAQSFAGESSVVSAVSGGGTEVGLVTDRIALTPIPPSSSSLKAGVLVPVATVSAGNATDQLQLGSDTTSGETITLSGGTPTVSSGSVLYTPSSTPRALTTFSFDDDRAVSDGSAEATRCLLLLVRIAQAVTQELSLDHQLPQLIELIVEGFNAERATLFLYDPETGELFSRITRGKGVAEIRIKSTTGIAGAVYGSGMTEIINDAYQDPRFNQEVDRRTGFRTRNILCVPLRNRLDQRIGVAQVLNKCGGYFTKLDASLLEAINRLVASALEQAQLVEKLDRARREEEELLAITEAISTELRIDALFTRIVHAATELLDAERSTLFLYDAATDELYSRVAEGADEKQIRIPANTGIAGAAFTSSEVLNVPDAYAHRLFNTEIDRNSGFRTRNLLSVPVIDRAGEHLGVLQVINKREGPFAQSDIRRLKAFSAEIAVAIQNARLFSDVLELKNYNESVLKSLSNGVVTFDQRLTVAKANEAAYRILRLSPESLLGRPAEQVFGNRNPWVTQSLGYVRRVGATDYHADTDLRLADDSTAAVNLTTAPIADLEGKPIGFMTVFEDITREKRVRHTMARYVAKEIVDRVLASGDDLLEGSALVTTVLFADIRGFSTLTEAMGPRQTVAMLNDYFEEMVEVIVAHNGMLDKYVGDGLMAIFGAPVSSGADADNALLVSNGMMSALRNLNSRRAGAGLEPLEIGLGLATGDVVAGSVGSQRRLEYAVVGSSVNLAARLESANKYYGTSVLLAEATVTSLQTTAVLRRLDLIRVKGILSPTEVYESLGYHTPTTFPNLNETIAAYEAGLESYLRRDWDSAIRYFGNALEAAPQDRPSRIFVDRCRYYRDNPPSDSWNGVWIMEQK